MISLMRPRCQLQTVIGSLDKVFTCHCVHNQNEALSSILNIKCTEKVKNVSNMS